MSTSGDAVATPIAALRRRRPAHRQPGEADAPVIGPWALADRRRVMYYSCTMSSRESDMAVSPVTAEPPTSEVEDDEALVYTMRDLNQQTARIMGEIEKTGKP